MSAFFLVAYAALSIPAVLAGLTATRIGLSSTFEIFGAAVAALALLWGDGLAHPAASVGGCAGIRARASHSARAG